ncbi:flagellar basal body rod protein FlgB [Ureibacillus chungkukjangi]|uniref:Flagellar basal body rod protein FlgB n=1 Tax=Ureibacillus chungkukjangi TaxID=1202712 RepID=A0A318TTD8_9BACL|nr:flagellar basal body rod protein FlgB [Ureibacillus chungkukjangi]MCM3386745.1 flagellar basal body rod protein FlgB [Ureibacillus chungkukjangi]PYF07100.1 flagellar basal-body rod protein FlgB [Ureibacillus chungkukjangi]
MNLFGGTISSLEKGLNYASLKNKTIAQNIANVDTPNYKAKNVNFEQMLSDAKEASTISAKRTDARHYDFQIQQSTPGVYSYDNFNYRSNGNGVDMDAEQASLAENTIYYNALVERVSSKFNTLNTVIKGGR